MLAALRARISERIARWARKRQGEDQLPQVLRARRLYILPTRAGYGAAALLFVMLIAGLNYTNSLALLLTFVLAGFVLVGMHECQRTLLGLELLSAQAADCNAGDEGLLELYFANSARSARRALTLRSGTRAHTRFDIGAGERLSVRVRHRCEVRGSHRIGRLELASTAPFGLFRSWTWLYLPVDVMVYPRPLGSLPLPPAPAGGVPLSATSPIPGEDEWTSLRAYQPGDSPRSVAWKVVARGGPLMVSQYMGNAGSDYRLSFAGLESLDLELSLSQLHVWVDGCARIGAAYSLELPAARIPLRARPAASKVGAARTGPLRAGADVSEGGPSRGTSTLRGARPVAHGRRQRASPGVVGLALAGTRRRLARARL